MNLTKLLTTTLALTWLLSAPVLAQSKGSSRDSGGTAKSEQSREPSHQKSREPAPSKSQGRDNGRSGKSRR
ncbi:MAG TPA: hypothetical protein VFZ61_33890 [Polyangiales bacterium]